MEKYQELALFQKFAGRTAVSDPAERLVLFCAVRQAIRIALQLEENDRICVTLARLGLQT
jgi:hypothetical protein